MKENRPMKSLSRFKKTAALAAALVVLAGWVGGLAYAASTTSSVQVRSSIYVKATGTPATGSLVWDPSTDGVSTLDFSNGSGATAVNKVYVASAATTTTVDLDSTLTDPAGGSVSFSRIACVRIIAGSANAANITIGGDWILSKYMSGWVDDAVKIPLHPNGRFEFCAPNATGVAVTASTGDELTITVTGSDSFKLVVLGS